MPEVSVDLASWYAASAGVMAVADCGAPAAYRECVRMAEDGRDRSKVRGPTPGGPVSVLGPVDDRTRWMLVRLTASPFPAPRYLSLLATPDGPHLSESDVVARH